MRLLRITSFLVVFVFASHAGAAEICGNGIDDDSNLLVDEGCYPGLATQCENPLSCEDAGYVAAMNGTSKSRSTAARGGCKWCAWRRRSNAARS